MEGEKGKERLELQSRYQGDDRFKLDEAFIDDDEDDMVRPAQSAQKDDDIAKELGDEKNQAMDVLRSMFGDIKVMTQTYVYYIKMNMIFSTAIVSDLLLFLLYCRKPDAQWSSTARFDPDADDASGYLIQPTKSEKEDDEDMDDVSSSEDDEGKFG